MNLEWLYISGPWAVVLWAVLVALLTLACLRALRRRREVVPGLAIFARVHAQNLPPAPPPRWLDKVFLLKTILLALLAMLCAGLALSRPTEQRRSVAFLVDDGPAGQYRLEGGGSAAAALQAVADRHRQDPAVADAAVELVARSQLPGPAGSSRTNSALPTVAEALQLLRARGDSQGKGFAEIHVFSASAPPGTEASISGGPRLVWHRSEMAWKANWGLVRVWVEPATGVAVESESADPIWHVWAEVVHSSSAGAGAAEAGGLLLRCQVGGPAGWQPAADLSPYPVPLGGGVIGPLAVRLPAAGDRIRCELIATDGVHQDAFSADDRIELKRREDVGVEARVLGGADAPMVRAALAAWGIPVVEADAAGAGGANRPQLWISDGGPQAEAELQGLRRAGRAVVPVYLNPAFDVGGLRQSTTGAVARVADRTFVPASLQARYGLLGRQSWQIAAVKPAQLLYGGETVVDSSAGPAVVRWVDGGGRPAWALLFDPTRSTLAHRDAGAWLAWWQVLRQEATQLSGGGAGVWQIDFAAAAGYVPDRQVSTLRPGPAEVRVLAGAPTTAAAADGAQRAVTSLGMAAAGLALVLLFLVIAAEGRRHSVQTETPG